MSQIPMFSKVWLSPRSGLWVCTILGGPPFGGSISLAVRP